MAARFFRVARSSKDDTPRLAGMSRVRAASPSLACGVAAAALLLAAAPAPAWGGNPLVPGVGQADPHIHFWPETGRYYAYATHDASPANTGFRMTDWWTWESADLVAWTLAGVLYPNATPAPPAAYASCWATDGAHRRDAASGLWRYFFYLSIGTCQVAVMESPQPTGPWVDVLGVPLLNASLGASLHPPACFRDPAVFEDDDGAHFLISGVFDYYIMRLGDDLTSLAEAPRLVAVVNPTGPYGAKTDDKPFIHKYNGVYYLSWGCFYATSASVYGPYTYVGSAIDTDFIAPDFRMNSTAGPWYSHEDYADRHGSFWHNGAGQWFYASNDRSHSSDLAHPDVYRDTVVGYVHYFANASIAAVVINGTGVGAYSARHIEAENFMRLTGAARKLHLPARDDAFVVAVDGSAELHFPHVSGAREAAALVLIAANAGRRAATITARSGRGGAVIATCKVLPSAGAFSHTACPLDRGAVADAAAATGELDLVLEVDGRALHIDSLAFD